MSLINELNERLASVQNEIRVKKNSGLDASDLETQEAELLKQIMDAENQVRVEEDVRENGYILDTMEIDGLTAPEIVTDDTQYELLRKGVQMLVVTLTTEHTNVVNDLKEEHKLQMKALNERATEAEGKAEKLQNDNKELEVKNYELGLENDELSEKVRKIAQIQYELEQQVAQQQEHINDLQQQISIGVRGSLNVVSIPQDTSKLAAEIIASKPRITNVRFKDEHGISTRIKKAEYVLTGDTFEYEAIYEKRYIILNADQAEQYRAEEAAKKAEAEAQQASIPTLQAPEIQPVSEVEAPAQEIPFQEEVQATDNGDLQGDQGNQSLHEMVEQESEVITLESLHERVKALELKVAA